MNRDVGQPSASGRGVNREWIKWISHLPQVSGKLYTINIQAPCSNCASVDSARQQES